MPTIKSHIKTLTLEIEETQDYTNKNIKNEQLLNTIKLPRNLSMLSKVLPKPMYEYKDSFLRRNISQPTSDQMKLPSINKNKNKGID
jgi:hypothetical protein